MHLGKILKKQKTKQILQIHFRFKLTNITIISYKGLQLQGLQIIVGLVSNTNSKVTW